jgi:hypothetical protein
VVGDEPAGQHHGADDGVADRPPGGELRAHRLKAGAGFTDWRVTLGWPQLVPSDEATEATTAEADLRMGIVSRQTIAEKRGYDWTVEQQRIEDDRAEHPSELDRVIETLDRLPQPNQPTPAPTPTPTPSPAPAAAP